MQAITKRKIEIEIYLKLQRFFNFNFFDDHCHTFQIVFMIYFCCKNE